MATEELGYSITLVADDDLSDYQFRYVAVSGVRECGLAGAADENLIGILQNKPDEEGIAATVARVGLSKIVGGAAFAVGAYLTSDATGRAVEAVEGERYGAIALEVGAEGRISTVLMEFGFINEAAS